MTTLVLRLDHAPILRVDLRALDSAVAATASAADVAHLPVTHGNETLEVGDFFTVTAEPDADDALELRLQGDLARFDRIGWRLASGRIVVEGDGGDYCGGGMTGGEILVEGHAGDYAGCAMTGGGLVIRGDVGDAALAPQPGDMEGMRGGRMVVHGNAGARFGDRMRRGTAAVLGDAGPFAGSRMIAGTLALGGFAGAHAGFGMRRGSIVFATRPRDLPPSFARVSADAGVIWHLVGRDLEALGQSFADLTKRKPTRFVGDLAVDGMGELLIA